MSLVEERKEHLKVIAELKSQLISQIKAKKFHLNTIKEIYDTQARQAKEITKLKAILAEDKQEYLKLIKIHGADAIREMLSSKKGYYAEELFTKDEMIDYADNLDGEQSHQEMTDYANDLKKEKDNA